MKKRQILLISPQSWGVNYVSKHHYALEMAQSGCEVYFINPLVFDSVLTFSMKQFTKDSNLHIIEYHVPRLLYYLRFHLRLLYDLIINTYVISAINNLSAYDELWCFDFLIFNSLKKIIAGKKILFVSDKPANDNLKKIIASSDFIVAVSEYLLSLIDHDENNKIFINHGLSKYFAFLAEKRLKVIRYVPNNPIEVGYAGNLRIGKKLD